MMWWKYQQLRSGSLKTRLATVAKLADTGHPDAIPPLLFALKDKTSEIRSSPAMALGQIQDDRVFEPLIKLLGDPVPSVRATAAQVLGRMPSANAGKNLAGLLQDPDVTVRINVVRSLDQLGWIPGDDASRSAYV